MQKYLALATESPSKIARKFQSLHTNLVNGNSKNSSISFVRTLHVCIYNINKTVISCDMYNLLAIYWRLLLINTLFCCLLPADYHCGTFWELRPNEIWLLQGKCVTDTFHSCKNGSHQTLGPFFQGLSFLETHVSYTVSVLHVLPFLKQNVTKPSN